MTTKPPQPKYKSSIDLGADFYVVRLAYSPDGRYLAIGDAASSNIVIWDVEKKREQARIHTRSNEGEPSLPSRWLHWHTGHEIHWSPDGRYVTNGVGNDGVSSWNGDLQKTIEFWDPMTGKVAHELSAIAVNGMTRFNRDGSKLLVHSGQFGPPYRYKFTIYDTNTWQGKNFDTDGVIVDQLTWTDDDKILVVGFSNPPDQGNLNLPDGQIVAHGSTVVEIIDPSGKLASSLAMLREPHKPGASGYSCRVLIPDFLHHQAVMIGADASVMLFDTRTMKILYSIDPKTLEHAADGSRGYGLSQDSRYLFLLNKDHKEKTTSFILDLETGQQVGKFTSNNTWGLAINPDGNSLAIGNENKVLFFDLQ